MSQPPTPVVWPVRIGQAAQWSGLSAKMVRYYESLGLLAPPTRTEAGHRLYGPEDVHTLRFIKRARELGFAMADVQELVGLWRSPERRSAQVKDIAQRHQRALRQRIERLQAMERALQGLTDGCGGDEHPGCPILDDLAGLTQDRSQLHTSVTEPARARHTEPAH